MRTRVWDDKIFVTATVSQMESSLLFLPQCLAWFLSESPGVTRSIQGAAPAEVQEGSFPRSQLLTAGPGLLPKAF